MTRVTRNEIYVLQFVIRTQSDENECKIPRTNTVLENKTIGEHLDAQILHSLINYLKQLNTKIKY